MRSGIVLAIFVLASTTIGQAAELPPAGDVRKKITEQPATSTATKEDPGLGGEIDAFAKKVAQMPPADAAAAWLALFDKYASETPMRSFEPGGIERITFARVCEALPPPAAWDALAKAIAARPAATDDAGKLREGALKILAAALTGNDEQRKGAVENFGETLLTRDRNDRSARLLAIAVADVNDADLVKGFEESIANWSPGPASQDLPAPDLVTLAGEARAAELLRKAVVLPGAQLDISIGDATKKLARKIALEEIEKLNAPQWKLCMGLDAVALYEATDKRFGPKAAATQTAMPGSGGFIARILGNSARVDSSQFENQWERQQAATYYLLGLIVAGRADDAMAEAKKTTSDTLQIAQHMLYQLEEAGHGPAVQAFLHRLLTENPDLPAWDLYVALSTKGGKTKEMLELARSSAARENLNNEQRATIRGVLAKALLAADQTDDGIAVLREVMSSTGTEEDARSSRMRAALQLARIGKLLQRQELIDQGVAGAKGVLAERVPRAHRDNYQRQSNVKSFASLLEDLGRAPDAANLLIDEIVEGRDSQRVHRPGESQELAIELLGIYHRADRHADVLELLTTLPSWGVADLAGIYTETDVRQVPVGHMAAAALADAGRKDDALKVLRAVLDINGGFDPAYESLIKLQGPAAIATLDELFARDQFQERPLIWKGALLFGDNKLADAEQVITQAISIDPSDGEQGKGTRMRVYAIYADILEKKGDAKKADIFRGAVKAIRTAEDADDWWEAGLLSRAIQQYEQALTYFQDAYCIQSRLALRMAEMGFMKQAEEHYRKAYELMPDSFGRMESHCFGCEGAFTGATARNIAKEVFAKLLVKTPDKPQLHYLLGYLSEQQGAYSDAIAPYQKAVAIDADYINAWKHLRDLGNRVHLSPQIKEDAALSVLRLDPLGRHSSVNVAEVRDLKRLYEAAAKSTAVRTPPPTSLLALPASAKELTDDDHAQPERAIRYYSDGVTHDVFTTPGGAVGQTRLLAAVGQVLDQQH